MSGSARPVRGQREAIEALKPYVTPDGYGQGTDAMRRENAERALSKAYPFIARAVRSRIAEALRSTDEVNALIRRKAADFIESLSDESLLGGEDG